MKDEIMQCIAVVLNALNTIPVSGKQNLANLSGSIATIEEVAKMLEGAEITAATENASEKRK